MGIGMPELFIVFGTICLGLVCLIVVAALIVGAVLLLRNRD